MNLMYNQKKEEMKKFVNAPLPFQGQKRRFVKQLEEMAMLQPEETTFVDLFGGSGLVSHIVKRARPDCRVVFNDYDHFSERLANARRTNDMIRALRPIVADVPHKMRITEPVRSLVLEEVKLWHQSGYVDWITLSSNLLFIMNYATNFEDFAKNTFYNRVRKEDYDVSGYLEGVEIVSMDYRPLFAMFQNEENVVFILDPPYLSTDCSTYNSADYWKLGDYLDVLKCLQGTKYVYYTSSKSSIIELAEFIEKTDLRENPFKGAVVHKHPVKGIALNYEDIMLVKVAA